MHEPTSADHQPGVWLLSVATRLLLSIASLPAMAGEVSLGVAANFTDTTRELAKQFEVKTGHTVSASFGSTGKLYAQIRNGAPFDVFMAADARRPALIEKSQAGVPNTRFTYARGKLVLWSPTPDAFGDAESYLAQQTFARLAMANPKTAPYGLAAQQVLEHLGHWTDTAGEAGSWRLHRPDLSVCGQPQRPGRLCSSVSGNILGRKGGHPMERAPGLLPTH